MTRTITPTHVLLNQVTLAANATDVTFSNIPQIYPDLVVFASVRLTGGAETRLRINGDSSNIYSMVQMAGDGNAGTLSNAGTTTYGWLTPNSFTNTANFDVVQINLFDVNATDKHKTYLSRYSPSFLAYTNALAVRWASTANITSLSFFPSANSFVAGCTFSLYGVHA